MIVFAFNLTVIVPCRQLTQVLRQATTVVGDGEEQGENKGTCLGISGPCFYGFLNFSHACQLVFGSAVMNFSFAGSRG